MTTTRRTPTPRQTASTFFGAGATSYPWWEITDVFGAFDTDEPDDWSVVLIAWHDIVSSEMAGQKTINHDVIVDVVDEIRRNASELGVSTDAWQECAMFLVAPDDADFDADMVDQVLQVAVMGKVTFG